jgi:O-methyltransferase involved in polyketide biosynthesis
VLRTLSLACGLDTYAWRIPMPSNVTYYEIDFPEVMQYKLSTLASATIVSNYRPISADLRDDSWYQTLVEFGFDSTLHKFFLLTL